MLRVVHHHAVDARPQLAHEQRGSLKRWMGEGLRQTVLFPSLRLVAPLTVEGRAHLRGAGPYLFAANHSSHLDAPLVLAALPPRLRMRLRVAAAADYFFAKRWKGALVSTLINAFAFERTAPGCNDSLEYAQRLLSAGQSVLIFPEGTRSQDGQMQPFKRGVGTLALGADIPVIPVHLEGAHAVLPKGAHWPRRQPVTIRFGAPLHFTPPDDPLRAAAQVEQAARNLAHSRP